MRYYYSTLMLLLKTLNSIHFAQSLRSLITNGFFIMSEAIATRNFWLKVLFLKTVMSHPYE